MDMSAWIFLGLGVAIAASIVCVVVTARMLLKEYRADARRSDPYARSVERGSAADLNEYAKNLPASPEDRRFRGPTNGPPLAAAGSLKDRDFDHG